MLLTCTLCSITGHNFMNYPNLNLEMAAFVFSGKKDEDDKKEMAQAQVYASLAASALVNPVPQSVTEPELERNTETHESSSPLIKVPETQWSVHGSSPQAWRYQRAPPKQQPSS